jgi:hypothetical protein
VDAGFDNEQFAWVRDKVVEMCLGTLKPGPGMPDAAVVAVAVQFALDVWGAARRGVSARNRDAL